MPRSRNTSIGDVPLAVPLHRVLQASDGWSACTARSRSRPRSGILIVQRQDGVHRALHRAGHVGRHVGHRHQVLVVDALVLDPRLDPREPARASGTREPPPITFSIRSRSRARRRGPAAHDRHVFLRRIHVQQSGALARRGDPQRLRDVVAWRCRAAPPSRRSTTNALLRLRVLDVPVDVDHAVGRSKMDWISALRSSRPSAVGP